MTTNLLCFLVLLQTNTVAWTNGEMRGESSTVDVNHAIQYQVGQQIWWDTIYAVDSVMTERIFLSKQCWEELVLPPQPVGLTNRFMLESGKGVSLVQTPTNVMVFSDPLILPQP